VRKPKKGTTMKISELQKTLQGLNQGEAATINYEMFAEVFPPGVEHDDSKEAAYRLAKANGCTIDHQARRRSVTFVKQ
jgi:hypothetical protein